MHCALAVPIGTVVVQPTTGQFSRGSSDTLVYPRLPHVGELLQMRVGTTGQGAFATWHLRQVGMQMCTWHVEYGCKHIACAILFVCQTCVHM